MRLHAAQWHLQQCKYSICFVFIFSGNCCCLVLFDVSYALCVHTWNFVGWLIGHYTTRESVQPAMYICFEHRICRSLCKHTILIYSQLHDWLRCVWERTYVHADDCVPLTLHDAHIHAFSTNTLTVACSVHTTCSVSHIHNRQSIQIPLHFARCVPVCACVSVDTLVNERTKLDKKQQQQHQNIHIFMYELYIDGARDTVDMFFI